MPEGPVTARIADLEEFRQGRGQNAAARDDGIGERGLQGAGSG